VPPADLIPPDAIAHIKEGDRIMTICNSCRYCEGYCAVFPAMERRITFTAADLNYLANLCHNCGECFYACQYAPPHEFAVNVPQILSEIRVDSYRQYAWPAPLGRAFQKSLWTPTLLAVILTAAMHGMASSGPESLFTAFAGDFYRVIPHGVMVAFFGSVSIFILTAHLTGFALFWRENGDKIRDFGSFFALKSAIFDVFSLEYLRSGGAGCPYPDEHHSGTRRWFHHFTFYGFLLCFGSTSVAAFYHYALDLTAPYGYFSVPVVLGTLGGLGLLVGPAGLFLLKLRQDRATASLRQNQLDMGFIVLLFLTSLTGLLLLALRETSVMGLLLVIHLAIVMALFLTLPYGKFVHGIYRAGALAKYALERARPNAGLES